MTLGYSGRGTAFGMAMESTYGTAVSRTDWMEAVSESLKRSVQRPFRPNLVSAAGAGGMQEEVFLAADDYGGGLECEAVYNAVCFGHMLYAAFGAVATTGAGPYAHTATLGTTLPSATIETLRGDGTAEVGEGMKCSTFELSMSPEDIVRVRTEWVGETSGGRESQGSPTYTSSAAPMLYSQAGVFAWNSVNYAKVTSLSWKLDNKLERRRYLGSAFTTEPDFGGWREGIITLGLHWDQDTFVAGMTAGTSSDGTITLTGAGNNSLALTGYNCIVDDASDPISGPGVVTQTVRLRCRGDSTNKGMQAVLNNDVAGSSYDW